MTPEEQAFVDALAAHPEDETTRLVYADWLTENGREKEGERQKRMAPGYRLMTELGMEPYVMDWDKSEATAPRGCEGVWFGWTFPQNPHSIFKKHIVPFDDWFGLIIAKNEYPAKRQVRNWSYFRRDAKDVVALAFADLPPERQQEILSQTKPR